MVMGKNMSGSLSSLKKSQENNTIAVLTCMMREGLKVRQAIVL